MKTSLLFASLLLSSTAFAATQFEQIDTYTVKASHDYLSDIPAQNANGTINAIIEIPTGTNEKWEVSKRDSSVINWEFKNGQPRIVHYLGYPGNYGTIPSTALPKSLGGDGDPLDILVLGSAMERGSVAPVRVIGGLKMLDGGEQDDKLIAVPVVEQSPFKDIESVEQLQKAYPGVVDIVKTWFANYKGPDGGMEIEGVMSGEEAQKVLEQAIKHFKA
ncbi:inorganic diphosphatase [Enterovibrio coralii]|uniref:inorganic diphosphatase n=1 Tax=Enterovibrio coralii TaxID=294935 RepID=A0A135I8S4_9GAMM|nr:inorganic diphosphatase [Enterovibrio coralii]KXF81850.1 inorganic diphosphatase [Enterovibrio coralii]